MTPAEVTDAQPADEAEQAGPTGRLVLPDLTTDLHVEIDGTTYRHRLHDLPPGVHTVVLHGRDGELARLSVGISAGTETRLPLASFPIRGVCLARGRGESLRPERATRAHCCTTDLAGTWLSRHQSESGMWSPAEFDRCCVGARCSGTGETVGDVEATALVLLTFLGAGETHNSGIYKQTVKAGLRALRECQDDDGWFSASRDRREHAVATLAMVDAYGITGSRFWKPSAQRSLALVLRAPPSTDAETAAMEACVLFAARNGELGVDGLDIAIEASVDGLRGFGPPETHAPRPRALLTAARALLSDDPKTDPEIVESVASLTSLLEEAGNDPLRSIDPLTVYFATIAAYRVGGAPWKAWNAVFKPAVIDTQGRSGAWEPSFDDAHGCARDRLSTTALLTLSLEVYYRYGRVFGASSR